MRSAGLIAALCIAAIAPRAHAVDPAVPGKAGRARAETAQPAAPRGAGSSPSTLAIAARPRAASPGAAPSSGSVPSSDDERREALAEAAWQRRFADARKELLSGRFREAAESFRALERNAPDERAFAVAAEMRRLCEELVRRDLTFVLRDDLGESDLSAKAVNRRTSDEIAGLYVSAVAYGLGTGAFLAFATQPEENALAILPALTLGGGAAAAVSFADSGEPLHYGVPQSLTAGMLMGFEHGLIWTLWHDAAADEDEELSDDTVAGVLWGSTTAGLLTGGLLATSSHTTPGRASFVGSASLWTGAVAGLSAGAIAADDERQDEAAFFAGAIGVSLGTGAGVLAAGQVSPTIARVRLLDLGAASGGIAATGLFLSAIEDEERPALAAGAVGIVTGLGVAWWLTDDMPDDRPKREVSERDSASPMLRVGMLPVRGGAGLQLIGAM